VPRIPIGVRRAGIDDLDAVLELWSQGRDEVTRLGRASQPAEQVAPRMAQALASGEIEILLADLDGRPAGFVIIRALPLSFMVDSRSLSIDQLYVTPQARRRGVAHALLGQVAARAEREGAEQIISSVTPFARDTHRFFARLGFSPLAVRRAVAPPTLRRRLAGESPRGGLEDLLYRRRSQRARARRVTAAGPPPEPVSVELDRELDLDAPAAEPGVPRPA
jgi:GNAT superfamily N-acetyltransferase